jgi:hypothetical protein
MYVRDQLLIIISSSGMLAMLGVGSGPSKATYVTHHYLRGYGHPNFLVALCTSTFGM